MKPLISSALNLKKMKPAGGVKKADKPAANKSKSAPVEKEEKPLSKAAAAKAAKAAKEAKTGGKSGAKFLDSANVGGSLTALQEKMLGVYSGLADRIEAEVFVNTEVGEDIGFYIDSLVATALLGKITSAMYVVSGPEQSAKSTLTAMMMGASLKNGTLINLHADAENSMRMGYMGGVVEQACGIPWSALKGAQDNKGRVLHHPRYRWNTQSNLDDIFDVFRAFLRSLPDKIYDAKLDEWFLVYPANISKDNKLLAESYAKMKDILPRHPKSNTNWIWFSVGKDESLQAVIAIDSIKGMTLTDQETGAKSAKQPAQLAKALAEVLPYVKGNLRRKHVAAMFINVVMENPLATQNRKAPEYETSGNALKLNSDVRCIMKPCAVREPFEKSKAKSDLSEEISVIHGGKDFYGYKSIVNIKNKTAMPGLRGYVRIWTRGADQSPGIDPVYDAAHFYEMIGLARLGSKAGRPIVYFNDDDLFLDDENQPIKSMEWEDFKIMILAERYGNKYPHLAEEMTERNICQLSLIENGFEIISTGESHRRINGIVTGNSDTALIDHTADDDSDQE